MSLINGATLEMIKNIKDGTTKAGVAEKLGTSTVGSTSVPIYLSNGVATRATNVVNTSGTQTISGTKTFSTAPKISATLSASLNDTTAVHAQWVNARIAEAELSGGDVDLSGYATTEWVAAQSYATTEWVAAQIAEAQLSGSGDVDLSSYATKEWVTAQIADAQLSDVEVDLSNYVTLSTEQTISGTKTFSIIYGSTPSVADNSTRLATTAFVRNAINAATSSLFSLTEISTVYPSGTTYSHVSVEPNEGEGWTSLDDFPFILLQGTCGGVDYTEILLPTAYLKSFTGSESMPHVLKTVSHTIKYYFTMASSSWSRIYAAFEIADLTGSLTVYGVKFSI